MSGISYVEFLRPVYVVGVGHLDRWTKDRNETGPKPVGIREQGGYLYLWSKQEHGGNVETRVPMSSVVALVEPRAKPAEKAAK